MNPCPCCGYRTLLTISNYEICDLCKWEDDGITDPESYSHSNHMTLSDAKKEFCEKSKKMRLNKWIKS
nr:CPCC family cysteine-rich protein [Pseudomonas sp. SWRI154]